MNNSASGDVGPALGGGVYFNRGRLEIRGSEFIDNFAGTYRAGNAEGGGIFNGSGDVYISESIFRNHELVGDGGPKRGGAINSNGGTVTLVDSKVLGSGIFSSIAFDGRGAEVAVSNTVLTVINSDITRNSTPDTGVPERHTDVGLGGGIFVGGGSTAHIRDSRVARNFAWDGGGIATAEGTALFIVNSTIASNKSHQGGGIDSQGLLDIAGSTIYGNVVDTRESRGGGIHATGDVFVSASRIIRNFARRAGGGLELQSGSLTITDGSVFRENVVGIDIGIIHGDGGGVHVSDGSADVEIHNSTFDGNVAADEGGGIWMAEESRLDVVRSIFADNRAFGFHGGRGGGAILIDGGSIRIAGSTIARNETRRHGAGLLLAVDSSARILNSRVDNNEARGGGGAIFNNGELELEDALVRLNTANQRGGIFTGSPGVTDVVNSDVSGNVPNDFAGPGTVN